MICLFEKRWIQQCLGTLTAPFEIGEKDRNVFLQTGSSNVGTTLIETLNFHCQEAVKLNSFADDFTKMATSDVVMEADSGFVRNIRSPGSSDLVIKVNGKEVDTYDEEREEIVGEGLFSFDEDVMPEKETGNLNEGSAKFDLVLDMQSDDSGNFDMSHVHSTFSGAGANVAVRIRRCQNLFQEKDLYTSAVEMKDDKEPEQVKKMRSLAYGSSLPITIPSGRFWPPRDAVDSVEDREIPDFSENPEVIDKTILPQRPPKDLYNEMRAQARSLQAVDDPERLFGERPSRRRYQTGEERVPSQVTAALQMCCEGATGIFSADMEDRMSR
uniref:Uncharacterized protein n=1 Tax=Setaria digitata TaxID=48799 RepID=A0A915PQ32_9BILA